MKSASTPGVPNPPHKQAHDLLGSPPQRVSGGWADQSFICPSPSLPITGITTWTILFPSPPPQPHSPCPWKKIIFHETGPCCQKVWGLQLYPLPVSEPTGEARTVWKRTCLWHRWLDASGKQQGQLRAGNAVLQHTIHINWEDLNSVLWQCQLVGAYKP